MHVASEFLARVERHDRDLKHFRLFDLCVYGYIWKQTYKTKPLKLKRFF